jgi:hypothetical protein
MVEDDGWCWEKVWCVQLGDLTLLYAGMMRGVQLGISIGQATVQCSLIPLIARSVEGVMDVHECSGSYSIIREGKQAVGA